MNLLVTGGAGFIGSNLIRQIIHEPELTKLVNLDCLTYAGHLESLREVAGHAKYVFERVNLRNKEAVEEVVRRHGVTHVLHLAAESHVDRSIVGPDDFVQTNVVGTCHLLEACRAFWAGNHHDRRFHHVSTDEVYGSLEAAGKFTELSPYAPNSAYAASKAAADMFVRAYQQTHGLPVLVTNCSNNYGPFQYPEKLIPVVIQSVLHRQPIPLYGDGLNVRDWLFVADHVQALWCVLRQGRPGQTYNIGGNNEWANLRIVERICDLVDELRPELGGHSRKLITFVKDRPGHDRRYAIDPLKIHRELGWHARCDFETGLRLTVRWYVENQEWVKLVLAKRQGALTNQSPAAQPGAPGAR